MSTWPPPSSGPVGFGPAPDDPHSIGPPTEVPAGQPGHGFPPRQPESETSGRRPRLGLLVVGIAAVLALVGAGAWLVTDHGHSSTKAQTVPVVSTSTTSVTSTTSTTVNGQHLETFLLPEPVGFVNEDRPQDGPLDVTGFDVYMGSRTTATDTAYLDGWDQTYDSTSSEDTVEIALFEFRTPSDASRFVAEYPSYLGVLGTADARIPGGRDYENPSPRPSQGYDHGVLVARGSRVAVIDYYDMSAARPPALGRIAQQQAARL